MRAEDADAFSREVAQFNSVLQRGQLCFMLGLRVFYFFLCLAFWVLGPVSLLVGTAFVLATLVSLMYGFNFLQEELKLSMY